MAKNLTGALPPACISCIHFNAKAHGGVGTSHLCNSPDPRSERSRFNPVLGVSRQLSCDEARSNSLLCGWEGKWHSKGENS